MQKGSKQLIAVLGFVYGLVLVFYAVAWGVDGPTLTMPLAASPLNVPAIVLDSTSFRNMEFLLAALMMLPLVAAPFCWAFVAVAAAVAEPVSRRTVWGAVLIAHYVGIVLWFAFVGSDYLLRPFRVLIVEGRLVLAVYVAGQALMWWALLRRKVRLS